MTSHAVFTASDVGGVGYVIAVAGRSLRFGMATPEGTGKVVVEPMLPTEFALHQNHPNPFNPETQITFDVPHACMVRLDIYNMAGQWIESLVDQPLAAGRHSVRWNPSGQPPGLYIYRLQGEAYVQTRKMLLVR